MSEQIKTNELFSCEDEWLKELFNEVYPWEILSKIKPFILEVIKNNRMGFIEIKEGVMVGNNVKISQLATIEAPAIIGDNSEIRPGAYLRGNVIIGKNCVIGNSTEIKNSVLLNYVQVPHYNYIGDSILGNFVHMGAGSICSNLKADKKPIVIHAEKSIQTNLKKIGAFIADSCEIGCGAVLNPGTIIGKNSNVYPLSSVRGVILPNVIYKNAKNIVKKQ